MKTKDFFLKVWAKNMGAYYTWQNMVFAAKNEGWWKREESKRCDGP